MDNITDLYVFCQSLVQMASGVSTVIKAEQGRDAPLGLYATYNPIPIRAVGHPRKDRTLVPAAPGSTDIPNWTDFDEVVVSQMDILLSCNFFNDGANDSAWKLYNANFRYPVQKLLIDNSVAWRYCSDARYLPGILQAGTQDRYQVDIMLYVEAEISETILSAAGFNIAVFDENGDQLFSGA